MAETVYILNQTAPASYKDISTQDAALSTEISLTIELSNRYCVSPIYAEWGFIPPKGKQVQDGFSYRSDSNDLWLTIEELRRLISPH